MNGILRWKFVPLKHTLPSGDGSPSNVRKTRDGKLASSVYRQKGPHLRQCEIVIDAASVLGFQLVFISRKKVMGDRGECLTAHFRR